MNRLQKKCFVCSLGLHGLVAVTLLASAGFRNRPRPSDLQIMTIIPANILDRSGAGGESPAVTVNRPPQALPPRVQPPPQPQPPVVSTPPVARPQPPAPRQPEEVERPEPEPRPSDDVALPPKPAARKPHEIHTTYELASEEKTNKKTKVTEKDSSRESAARAEARRLREIQESLGQLANGVAKSAAPSTTVNIAGIGGGEAFASYRNAIFNAYYHAWNTPDSLSDRTAEADAKVTIARDGTVISAEIVRPSGNGALDRSVDRALRAVKNLPPFPASAQDQERTFTIQFTPSLETK
jgi:TonB family protein